MYIVMLLHLQLSAAPPSSVARRLSRRPQTLIYSQSHSEREDSTMELTEG
jgi:hypothetical protein